MKNEIATQQGGAIALTEPELLNVLGSSLYPGAAIDSIKLVLGYCKAASLDPMQKPVHIVPIWDKSIQKMRDVVMPGIGLYRTQAARTGEHVGTDEPVYGPLVTYKLAGGEVEVPEWCKVTVWRLKGGQRCAFTACEFWIENYATAKKDTSEPNSMWKKRSRGQLAKCAEAQALRKGFPEVGSQPTAEEMEGKVMGGEYIDNETGEVRNTSAPAKQEPPTWPAESFATQLPRWTKAVEAGMKSVDDIIAMATSKGALTPEQEKAIRALKPKAAESPLAAAAETVKDELDRATDEFTAALDRAAQGDQE